MDKEEQLLYWKKTSTKYRSTYKHKISELFRSTSRRSIKNNWDFDLTKEWISEKLKTNVCEISGEPFVYVNITHKTHFNPYAPSIDRIDSSKGYTMDNCRIVLSCINMAIGEWGLETYLHIAQKAISNQKK